MLLASLSEKENDKSDYKNEKTESFFLYELSKKYLYNKYTKFKYSYSMICTDHLIFNEKCRIVGKFKDFLIFNDNTEFIDKYYNYKDLEERLKNVFFFYEHYCKIYPNYMILTENRFLYKNIRKKQKLIDALNEIKKEEEENRKQKYLYKKVFNEKTKESIEKYNQSLTNTLNYSKISKIKVNETELTDKSIANISLNSNNQSVNNKQEKNTNENSDIKNNNSLNSQNSIFSVIKLLKQNKCINKKIIKKDKNYKFSYFKKKYVKRKNKDSIANIDNNTIRTNKTNNHSKDKNKTEIITKFFFHKQNVSLPIISQIINDENSNNKTLKIIHNINNIIINDKINNKNQMIININSNYYQLKNTNTNINNSIKSNEKSIFNLREKLKKIDFNKKRTTQLKEKTFTCYNTLSNTLNRIKPIFKNILSPKSNDKKIKSNSKQNNKYKKAITRNDLNKKNAFKFNIKLIEYKTFNSKSSDKNKKENKNIFCNKIKIIKNKKIVHKLAMKINNETKDKTKTSTNKKKINKCLTTNKKNKVHKRPFSTYDSTFFHTAKKDNNNNKNKAIFESNNILDKTKNFTTIKDPINSKINKKEKIYKSRTDSIQTNNNSKFLSTSNLTNETIVPRIKKEINKTRNYRYNKILLYNKTQINSDTEGKNISKTNHNVKPNKKLTNNDIIKNNWIKKLRINKYHKLLNKNKNGSYELYNKLKVMKKHRNVNSTNWSISNIISNIKSKKNKIKKLVLNPDEKINGILNNLINTPIKIKQNNTSQKKYKKENIKDCKLYFDKQK